MRMCLLIIPDHTSGKMEREQAHFLLMTDGSSRQGCYFLAEQAPGTPAWADSLMGVLWSFTLASLPLGSVSWSRRIISILRLFHFPLAAFLPRGLFSLNHQRVKLKHKEQGFRFMWMGERTPLSFSTALCHVVCLTHALQWEETGSDRSEASCFHFLSKRPVISSFT